MLMLVLVLLLLLRLLLLPCCSCWVWLLMVLMLRRCEYVRLVVVSVLHSWHVLDGVTGVGWFLVQVGVGFFLYRGYLISCLALVCSDGHVGLIK